MTLSTLLRGSVYERLRWTFKLYDINGDGCISRGELGEIVLAVHELMGRRAHQVEDDRKARDQIDRVFRKLDLNQDGVITIEEFMESCLKDDVITRSLQMFDTVLWCPLQRTGIISCDTSYATCVVLVMMMMMVQVFSTCVLKVNRGSDIIPSVDWTETITSNHQVQTVGSPDSHNYYTTNSLYSIWLFTYILHILLFWQFTIICWQYCKGLRHHCMT